MKRLPTTLIGLAGLACIAGGAAACSTFCDRSGDQEETVSMNDLPATVRRTVEAELAGRTPEEIEREVEDGRVVYDVTISEADELEFSVADDGRFLGYENDDEDHDDDDAASGDDDEDHDADDDDNEEEDDD